MTTPRDWDGRSYDAVAEPQARWGAAVLERLELRGDERVLDAGCGSGRVTELLAERLPAGHVVALDGSPAMLDEARRRLERFGDRVTLVQADLREPLPIDEPVDAIFSTATFHWIHDHAALYRHLAAVIRPGGRLVAQYGGGANTASVRRSSRRSATAGPATRSSPGPTRRGAGSRRPGSSTPRPGSTTEPTRFEPGEPFKAFLRTVILGAHLARLPEAEREPFVDEVAARLPKAEIDYVRLNVTARRGTPRRGPG